MEHVSMPNLVDLCLSVITQSLHTYTSFASVPADIVALIVEELNTPTQPPHTPYTYTQQTAKLLHTVALPRVDLIRQEDLDLVTWLRDIKGTPLAGSLLQLDLSDTHINDQGLALLSHVPRLKHLALRNCNKIQGNGFNKVTCKFEFLNLRNCTLLRGRHLVSLLPGSKDSLTTLILSGCTRLKDEDMHIMAQFTKLRSLRLSHCDKLGHRTFVHLSNAQSLHTLSMAHCFLLGTPAPEFSDDAIHPLLSMPQLQHLNLSFCFLHDRSLPLLRAIAKGSFMRLISLKIKQNSLSRGFFLSLCSLCSQGMMPALSVIDLSSSLALPHVASSTGNVSAGSMIPFIIQHLSSPTYHPFMSSIKISSHKPAPLSPSAIAIPTIPLALPLPLAPAPTARRRTSIRNSPRLLAASRALVSMSTSAPAPSLPPVPYMTLIDLDPAECLPPLGRYAPPVAFSSQSPLSSDGTGRIVLLGEDEAFQVLIVKRELEKRHFTVLVASDGKSALDTYMQHPEISLVLMDVFMPVMDGLTSIKHIRKFEEESKRRRTTIVVVSSNPRHSRMMASVTYENFALVEAGGDAFIQKPFRFNQLDPIVPMLHS